MLSQQQESKGVIIREGIDAISETGRVAQGVSEGDSVAAVAKILQGEETELDEE